MRRALVLVTVVVSALCAAWAQAAPLPSLSIRISAGAVSYGHAVTLSGRLSGGVAGRLVEISARRSGQHSMTRVGTARTGAGGIWSIRVAPSIDTAYEAALGSVVTPALWVGVEPALAAHAQPTGTIFVHAAAGRALIGRSVELQLAAGPRWVTTDERELDGKSDTIFPAPIGTGHLTMRIVMSAGQAGHGLLGGTSPVFTYRVARASISLAAVSSVRYGQMLELSGRLSDHRAGQQIVITARPFRSTVVRRSSVTSGASGRWHLRVAPAIQTSYQAAWAGLTSRKIVVGVHPSIRVVRLPSGGLLASVLPAGRLDGRNVELQRLVGTRWKTVEQRRLGRDSVLFAAPPEIGSARLRVAMSVNQVGAGYLVAMSVPLQVRRVVITLIPSSFRVLYGHSFTLSGSVSTRQSGVRVSIRVRPYGSSKATQAVTVVTGPSGRWSLRAAPSVETSYTASFQTTTSRTVVVGVEPRIKIAVLADRSIETHVASKNSLRGRTIELQELVAGGRWKTLVLKRLDRRASAAFTPLPISSSVTLRIAMSVNQAGAGLLGTASHAFTYRGAGG